MREMAVHETFDALSPKYDKLMSTKVMNAITARHVDVPFEIFRGRAFVFMRVLMDHG